MKFCEKCLEEFDGKDGDNVCEPCETSRTRRNTQRRARHQAMVDLGLVRVRGVLGGVYYE